MQRGVTEEPLPKSTFDRIFKSMLKLSGYFGIAIVHAIRRYLLKKLNGKWSWKADRTQNTVLLRNE